VEDEGRREERRRSLSLSLSLSLAVRRRIRSHVYIWWAGSGSEVAKRYRSRGEEAEFGRIWLGKNLAGAADAIGWRDPTEERI
jgi:hypothetical protein